MLPRRCVQLRRVPAIVSKRPARGLSSTSVRLNREQFDPANVERAEDEVDVCIVGGGPAGLSAAIRLKQLEKERGKEIRVVVLEKGSEVGSHILSGAVVEPRALNELLPSWQSETGHPLTRPATNDSMIWLTKNFHVPLPHPPQMSNKGNYIVSLSQFTSWLGTVAEELGVEIYPGFAGAQLMYSEDGVQGVITNEVGLDRQRRMKSTFEPGMAFRAKVTLLGEGAHGSLSKTVINKYKLRANSQPQTYGIGLKEVWRVDTKYHEPGKVVHTLGWPMDYKTYGGGFVYHMDGGLVSMGLVVGLDYKNPYLSPYREFQRMKHHPYFRKLLSGDSTRLAYGARSLNEGGLQSVPQLHFPGGALIGCSAGFVNLAKIKGTHNAMKSGMLAAEAAYDVVHSEEESSSSSVADMSAYSRAFKDSWIYSDLHEIRNLRPSFNTPLGVFGGIMYSGIDSLILKGRVPWTFKHTSHTPPPNTTLDAVETEPASRHQPIEYPPFEPPLSTDLMTSVALTGTNHAEDQPVHLRVMKTGADEVDETSKRRLEHVRVNVGEYAGLLGRACPAGVYEYVDVEGGDATKGEAKVEDQSWNGKKLVINSQNCIHCKLCDIKVPTQDITWTVPEGGGGPKYSVT